MRGKRDFGAFGGDHCIFGYIKNNAFVYSDYDYTFPLEGGKVKDDWCLQMGGFCMVDVIKMEDGTMYTLNEETVIKYKDRDTYNKEFVDQTLNFYDAQEAGLISTIAVDVHTKERDYQDWLKHEVAYFEWKLECRLREIQDENYALNDKGEDMNEGFDFKGTWIGIWELSGCMRFEVDPVKEYGQAYLDFVAKLKKEIK